MSDMQKKLSRVVVGAAAVLVSLTSVGAASAATSVVGGPYTNLNPAGATIRLQLSNFPTSSGLYIRECLITVDRPASDQCNAASQVWISTRPGATFKPTDVISINVLGAFGSVNCLTQNCGLFFQVDHTAADPTNDKSEDRFIPISFTSSSTPTLPQDEITTKANGVALASNSVGTLAYRTPTKLDISTKSGTAATVKVYGDACTVQGITVTALKGTGQCDIAVSSAGNASYSAVTVHYPVNLTLGVQNVLFTVPKQIVGSKLLFTSKAVTNMGEKPVVTISPSNLCSLKTVGVNKMVVAKATGTCTVTITAPGRDGLYSALNKTYTVTVKTSASKKK